MICFLIIRRYTKKFIALMIKAMVGIRSIVILIILVISIHFTRNLARGGIPAKLAIIIIISHFFVLVLISVFNTFILAIFSIYIIIMTEAQ